VGHARALGARVVEAEVDVRDPDATRALVERERPSLIVHTAAKVAWRADPSLTLPLLHTNVLGTAAVLEAARVTGARVVVVGSASESVSNEERAREVYTIGKRVGTALALLYSDAFDTWTTVVRPFNVYGPGEAPTRLFPSLFARAAAGGGEYPCTPGDQIRDFVHVDEVTDGILRAAATDRSRGQVIDLGTGRGISVREAIALACRITGGTVIPRPGALPANGHEPPRLVANTERTRAILGWAPSRSLEASLAQEWDAFRKQHGPGQGQGGQP
jgi:nucleoside-diphosphate-sugar epimerase